MNNNIEWNIFVPFKNIDGITATLKPLLCRADEKESPLVRGPTLSYPSAILVIWGKFDTIYILKLLTQKCFEGEKSKHNAKIFDHVILAKIWISYSTHFNY